MDLFNNKKKDKVKESVKRIIDKYPDRVPVFVTRGANDKHLNLITNNKFKYLNYKEALNSEQ